MMGRACLKEELEGVKVRFYPQNSARRGQNWHLLLQTGQFAPLRVVVVWLATRKLSRNGVGGHQ